MQYFSRRSSRWLRVGAFLGLAAMSATAFGLLPTGSEPVEADISWIGYVNHYRSQSKLPAVKRQYKWDVETKNHSCYMTANGPTHTEVVGKPGYTLLGKRAGENSNVAGPFTPTGNTTADMSTAIDYWMSSPLHAIGLLRPGLRETSLGLCSRNNKLYATLDVLRGLQIGFPKSVVFPGSGATTRLNSYSGETPDLSQFCPSKSTTYGLPLIAMFTKPLSDGKADLKFHGTTWSSAEELCVLDHNDVGPGSVASEILRQAEAVVIFPPDKLANGNYKVRVWDWDSNSKSKRQEVAWWFTVRAP